MTAASLLFDLTVAGYAAAAVALLMQRLPGRSNVGLAGACAATAVWSAVAAPLTPLVAGPAASLDFVRTAAWFGYLLLLARRTTGRPNWPGGSALAALAFGLVALAAALLTWRLPGPSAEPLVEPLGVLARIGLAIAILLLIENLYRNAPSEARWHINLACIAVGGLFLYQIFLYADAVLHRRVSPLLYVGQAPANLFVLPLLLLAAHRQKRWKEEVGVSRSVVFHTATLLLSGIFLVGLAAAGEVLRRFGSGWGMLAEASLIFAGCILIAVLATSGGARSRVRRLVVDHFFTRRYDYQHEWARCIGTLSADPYLGLHKRVIRAIADIVDSPAGILFLGEAPAAGQPHVFRAAGSWNAPRLEGVAVGLEHSLIGLFRGGDWVAAAAPSAPPWFAEFPAAWLAVPLPADGELQGFIVLGPARAPFRLDREVFELLRIVGREIALFIAEQRATQALVEARQFAETGRRFSFVAHDIKNLAAQLSLLLGNAEQHLGNPAFRADMLATLRSSVQRISTLLARLQAPLAHEATTVLAPARHLTAVVTTLRRSGQNSVVLETDGGDANVAIGETTFDTVIRHLIDNALEASPAGAPVRVRLAHERERVVISVIDQGTGMSDEFVRERLFRPFASTKSSGFGLGAFQARALLREAGGDLTVTSVPGQGTTMRVILPLPAGRETGAPLALLA
ncbi:MAG: XrtA/PEP-CTERM system histidine kinase PrsK [Acetobacteraceae bacterium]